jgi:alcohol dehydrogenase class IV
MFSLRTQLFSGVSSTYEFISEIELHGVRKVLLLVDKAVADNSMYFQRVRESLAHKFMLKVYNLKIIAEPTYSFLDEVLDQVRGMGKFDLIIGIGGGSALDTTKAVAALLNNQGRSIEFRGFNKIKNPGVPVACIPTTAGTGSEVTFNASFIDSSEMRKMGINGKNLFATYAVLDAKFTESCPRPVALSSGLDALVHTFESFTAKQANQVTRLFSINAFKLIYGSIEVALSGNQTDQSRQDLLLGSYFAGAALFNSGSGISGAISYPIGVHFKVPHGYAGGITLPSVIKFNLDNKWFKYADLLDAVDFDSRSSDESKSRNLYEKIQELYQRINAPVNFDFWNLSMKDLPKLKDLCKDLQPAFDQNPIYFSAETDVPILLSKHFS